MTMRVVRYSEATCYLDSAHATLLTVTTHDVAVGGDLKKQSETGLIYHKMATVQWKTIFSKLQKGHITLFAIIIGPGCTVKQRHKYK